MTRYDIGLVVAIPLGFLGLFGMFGLMVGRLDISTVGFSALMLAMWLIETCSWEIRMRNNPEYALKRDWDDEEAEYVYSLEYYGRVHETGDKKWADKISKHYKIGIS